MAPQAPENEKMTPQAPGFSNKMYRNQFGGCLFQLFFQRQDFDVKITIVLVPNSVRVSGLGWLAGWGGGAREKDLAV